MEQLSAADASMLYVETPQTPNVIVAVMIYDPSTAAGGKVSFDTALEYVQRRLPLAKAFRRKLVRVPFDLDHPYWVEDPDFDLEFHVRGSALPRPGTWRQLWDQIARIGARPLDLSRPPWELYMVEGLNRIEGVPAGSFALILKLHHAAVDGKSGVALIEALQTHDPDAELPAALETWKPETPPANSVLLGRALYRAVGRPFGLVRMVGETPGRLLTLRRMLSGGRQRPPFWVPRTRFNHAVSAHRSADAVRLLVEDLKRCRDAVPGASVNDAVLTVVSGGLRRYLDAKGELPSDSLVALMPISIRRPDDPSGGNLFAMATVSLHTDTVEPLALLAAIHKSTRDAKEIQQAVPARALTEVSEYLPGALTGLAFRALAGLTDVGPWQGMNNTIVTNVPGPRTHLYFAGAKCIAEYGMAPFNHGVGLTHAVGSYVDMFGISFTADRAMMPDPAFYAECLRESFEDLLCAAEGIPASPK
jgi:diacylglycerol O-acyltransferase